MGQIQARQIMGKDTTSSVDWLSLPFGTKLVLDDEPNRVYTKTKPGMRHPSNRLGENEIYVTSPGTIGLDLSQDYLSKHAKLA